MITDQDNLNLLKTLAEAIGIPNLHLEIEDGENEKDTLIIEYSEYIIYVSEDKPYLTGHIVHFPGSYNEPPDEDYLDRMSYHTFADAAQDIIMHIATEKIKEAMEFHWFSNLPPDVPGCPVSDLRDESTPYVWL